MVHPRNTCRTLRAAPCVQKPAQIKLKAQIKHATKKINKSKETLERKQRERDQQEREVAEIDRLLADLAECRLPYATVSRYLHLTLASSRAPL